MQIVAIAEHYLNYQYYYIPVKLLQVSARFEIPKYPISLKYVKILGTLFSLICYNTKQFDCNSALNCSINKVLRENILQMWDKGYEIFHSFCFHCNN